MVASVLVYGPWLDSYGQKPEDGVLQCERWCFFFFGCDKLLTLCTNIIVVEFL
jgi:hypothetical protein